MAHVKHWAILDDRGIVHNKLTETECLAAWAVLTNDQVTLERMTKKERKEAAEKYVKLFTGELQMARVLYTFDPNGNTAS